MQQSQIREGYLILADISGYTAFLTGTELEHAHGILEELTTLMRQRLAPPLRFFKLEGDCVFCYALPDTFGSGERLIELVETCYVDFSDRLLDMQRATTCRCAACASLGSLDLKFIAHYGPFVVRRDDRSEDLTGPDVILAHRLLKNTIVETTGTQAYAFFTDACLARLPAPPQLARYVVTYESFGDISGGVEDLKHVLAAMRESRAAYVTVEEADFGFTSEVHAAPAVLWDAWMDPQKRLRWETDLTGLDHQANERGRTGIGATTHCAHGSALSLHRYVDWRPFRYWTDVSEPVKGFMAPPAMTSTVEFTPGEDGRTTVTFRARLRDRGFWSRLQYLAFAPMIRRSLARMAKLLKQVGEAEANSIRDA